MRRWVLFGLTVFLFLALTGCQGNWLATEGYVDQRIEAVDAKYAGAWDAAERTALAAQAAGKAAGDAALAGLRSGASQSREALPTTQSDMEWLVSLLETLGVILGGGAAGTFITRILRGGPLKSGAAVMEPQNVRKPSGKK